MCDSQQNHGQPGASCEWCRTPYGPSHRKSCFVWFFSELFFVLGLVALVAAWVTDYKGTTWLGVESAHLFSDAAAFLILSVIFKLKKLSFKVSMMKMMMDTGCGDDYCNGDTCANDGSSEGGVCGDGICSKGEDCCGGDGCSEEARKTE